MSYAEIKQKSFQSNCPTGGDNKAISPDFTL